MPDTSKPRFAVCTAVAPGTARGSVPRRMGAGDREDRTP
jgi:hypothetical protein